MRGLFLSMLGALAWPATLSATVLVDPVPPVAPGIAVGVRPFAQALAGPGGSASLQAMRPLPDGSGRSTLINTTGLVEVVGAAGGTPSVYLDVRSLPGFTNAPDANQTGLMSVAFHPNFAGDPGQPGYGKLYVVTTATAASGAATLAGNGPVSHHDVVTEITVADPRAATAQVTATREVLRMAQPERDHGPGTIGFDPYATPGTEDYGKLYIGLGDGGGWGDPHANAQDPTSPFGKILRIDPLPGAGGAAYSVPDNKTAAGELPEIYASGLRNPQMFSWAPPPAAGQDPRMLSIDIGLSSVEEVNVIEAGKNYGWPKREGTFALLNPWDNNVSDTPANDGRFTDPVAQFDHEEIFRSGQYGLAAISGVFAYAGSVPELQGMAVLSELDSGRLFYFPLDRIGADGPVPLRELFLTLDGQPTSMAALDSVGNRADLRLGEDGAGELYLLAKTTGDIWALVAGPVPEPATWAQLLLGFALLGAALRRRGSSPATA